MKFIFILIFFWLSILVKAQVEKQLGGSGESSDVSLGGPAEQKEGTKNFCDYTAGLIKKGATLVKDLMNKAMGKPPAPEGPPSTVPPVIREPPVFDAEEQFVSAENAIEEYNDNRGDAETLKRLSEDDRAQKGLKEPQPEIIDISIPEKKADQKDNVNKFTVRHISASGPIHEMAKRAKIKDTSIVALSNMGSKEIIKKAQIGRHIDPKQSPSAALKIARAKYSYPNLDHLITSSNFHSGPKKGSKRDLATQQALGSVFYKAFTDAIKHSDKKKHNIKDFTEFKGEVNVIGMMKNLNPNSNAGILKGILPNEMGGMGGAVVEKPEEEDKQEEEEEPEEDELEDEEDENGRSKRGLGEDGQTVAKRRRRSVQNSIQGATSGIQGTASGYAQGAQDSVNGAVNNAKQTAMGYANQAKTYGTNMINDGRQRVNNIYNDPRTQLGIQTGQQAVAAAQQMREGNYAAAGATTADAIAANMKQYGLGKYANMVTGAKDKLLKLKDANLKENAGEAAKLGMSILTDVVGPGVTGKLDMVKKIAEKVMKGGKDAVEAGTEGVMEALKAAGLSNVAQQLSSVKSLVADGVKGGVKGAVKEGFNAASALIEDQLRQSGLGKYVDKFNKIKSVISKGSKGGVREASGLLQDTMKEAGLGSYADKIGKVTNVISKGKQGAKEAVNVVGSLLEDTMRDAGLLKYVEKFKQVTDSVANVKKGGVAGVANAASDAIEQALRASGLGQYVDKLNKVKDVIGKGIKGGDQAFKAVSGLLEDTMRDAGLGTYVDKFNKVKNAVVGSKNKARDAIAAAGGLMEDAMREAGLGPYVDKISKVTNAFMKNDGKGMVENVVGEVSGLVEDQIRNAGFGKYVDQFHDLKDAAGKGKSAFMDSALDAAGNMLRDAGFGEYVEKGMHIKDAIQNLASKGTGGIEGAVDAAMDLGGDLLKKAGLGDLVDKGKNIIGTAKGLMKNGVGNVGEGMDLAGNALGSVLQSVGLGANADGAQKLIGSLKSMAQGNTEDGINGGMAGIVSLMNANGMGQYAEQGQKLFSSTMDMINGKTDVVESFKNFAGSAESIGNSLGLGKYIQGAKDIYGSVSSFAQGNIAGAMSGAKGALSGLLKEHLGGPAGDMANQAVDTITGLASGNMDAAGLANAGKGFAMNILSQQGLGQYAGVADNIAATATGLMDGSMGAEGMVNSLGSIADSVLAQNGLGGVGGSVSQASGIVTGMMSGSMSPADLVKNSGNLIGNIANQFGGGQVGGIINNVMGSAGDLMNGGFNVDNLMQSGGKMLNGVLGQIGGPYGSMAQDGVGIMTGIMNGKMDLGTIASQIGNLGAGLLDKTGLGGISGALNQATGVMSGIMNGGSVNPGDIMNAIGGLGAGVLDQVGVPGFSNIIQNSVGAIQDLTKGDFISSGKKALENVEGILKDAGLGDMMDTAKGAVNVAKKMSSLGNAVKDAKGVGGIIGAATDGVGLAGDILEMAGLGEVADTVKGVFGSLGDSFKSIQNALPTGLNDVKSGKLDLGSLGSGLTSGIGSIAGKLGLGDLPGIGNLGNLGDLGKSLSLDNIGGTMMNLLNVGDLGKNAKSISQTLSKFGVQVPDFGGMIKDLGGGVGGQVMDTMKSLGLDTLGQSILGDIQNGGDVVDTLKEKATDFIDKIKDDPIESAKKMLKMGKSIPGLEGVVGIGGQVLDTVDKLKNMDLSKIGSNIGDALKMGPDLLRQIPGVGDELGSFGDQMLDNFEKIKNIKNDPMAALKSSAGLLGKIPGVGSDITSKISKVADTVTDGLKKVTAIKNLGIKDLGPSALKNGLSSLNEIFGQIPGLGKVSETIGKTMQIGEKVIDMSKKAIGGFQDMVGTLSNAKSLGDITKGLTGGLSGLGKHLGDIGSIGETITGSLGDFGGIVGNLAKFPKKFVGNLKGITGNLGDMGKALGAIGGMMDFDKMKDGIGSLMEGLMSGDSKDRATTLKHGLSNMISNFDVKDVAKGIGSITKQMGIDLNFGGFDLQEAFSSMQSGKGVEGFTKGIAQAGFDILKKEGTKLLGDTLSNIPFGDAVTNVLGNFFEGSELKNNVGRMMADIGDPKKMGNNLILMAESISDPEKLKDGLMGIVHSQFKNPGAAIKTLGIDKLGSRLLSFAGEEVEGLFDSASAFSGEIAGMANMAGDFAKSFTKTLSNANSSRAGALMDPLKDMAAGMGGQMKNMFGGMMKDVNGLRKLTKNVAGMFGGDIDGVMGSLSGVLGEHGNAALSSIGNILGGEKGLNGILGTIGGLIQGENGGFGGVIDKFSEMMDNGDYAGMLGSVGGMLGGEGSGIGGALSSAAGIMKGNVKEGISGMLSSIGGMVGGASSDVSGIISGLGSAVSGDLAGGAKGVLKGIAGMVGGQAGGIMNSIGNIADSGIVGDIQNLAEKMMSGNKMDAVNGVMDMMKGGKLGKVAGDLTSMLGGPSDMVTNLIDAAGQAVGAAKDVFDGIKKGDAGSVLGTVGNAINNIGSMFGEDVGNIASGIGGIVSNVGNMVNNKDGAGGYINGAGAILGNVGSMIGGEAAQFLGGAGKIIGNIGDMVNNKNGLSGLANGAGAIIGNIGGMFGADSDVGRVLGGAGGIVTDVVSMVNNKEGAGGLVSGVGSIIGKVGGMFGQGSEVSRIIGGIGDITGNIGKMVNNKDGASGYISGAGNIIGNIGGMIGNSNPEVANVFNGLGSVVNSIGPVFTEFQKSESTAGKMTSLIGGASGALKGVGKMFGKNSEVSQVLDVIGHGTDAVAAVMGIFGTEDDKENKDGAGSKSGKDGAAGGDKQKSKGTSTESMITGGVKAASAVLQGAAKMIGPMLPPEFRDIVTKVGEGGPMAGVTSALGGVLGKQGGVLGKMFGKGGKGNDLLAGVTDMFNSAGGITGIVGMFKKDENGKRKGIDAKTGMAMAGAGLKMGKAALGALGDVIGDNVVGNVLKGDFKGAVGKLIPFDSANSGLKTFMGVVGEVGSMVKDVGQMVQSFSSMKDSFGKMFEGKTGKDGKKKGFFESFLKDKDSKKEEKPEEKKNDKKGDSKDGKDGKKSKKQKFKDGAKAAGKAAFSAGMQIFGAIMGYCGEVSGYYSEKKGREASLKQLDSYRSRIKQVIAYFDTATQTFIDAADDISDGLRKLAGRIDKHTDQKIIDQFKQYQRLSSTVLELYTESLNDVTRKSQFEAACNDPQFSPEFILEELIRILGSEINYFDLVLEQGYYTDDAFQQALHLSSGNLGVILGAWRACDNLHYKHTIPRHVDRKLQFRYQQKQHEVFENVKRLNMRRERIYFTSYILNSPQINIDKNFRGLHSYLKQNYEKFEVDMFNYALQRKYTYSLEFGGKALRRLIEEPEFDIVYDPDFVAVLTKSLDDVYSSQDEAYYQYELIPILNGMTQLKTEAVKLGPFIGNITGYILKETNKTQQRVIAQMKKEKKKNYTLDDPKLDNNFHIDQEYFLLGELAGTHDWYVGQKMKNHKQSLLLAQKSHYNSRGYENETSIMFDSCKKRWGCSRWMTKAIWKFWKDEVRIEEEKKIKNVEIVTRAVKELIGTYAGYLRDAQKAQKMNPHILRNYIEIMSHIHETAIRIGLNVTVYYGFLFLCPKEAQKPLYHSFEVYNLSSALPFDDDISVNETLMEDIEQKKKQPQGQIHYDSD